MSGPVMPSQYNHRPKQSVRMLGNTAHHAARANVYCTISKKTKKTMRGNNCTVRKELTTKFPIYV